MSAGVQVASIISFPWFVLAEFGQVAFSSTASTSESSVDELPVDGNRPVNWILRRGLDCS